MPVPQPTNDDPQRLEQIVAYLDGELSAEESARVEQRLATDESFRQELQSIDRAWTALDQLPVATVDDRFSKTTMELVVDDARQELEAKTQALPLQRRKRSLTTLLLATTAMLLGGLTFRLVWHNPNQMLVADLPVIYGIDIYSQFRDAGFLRQLQQAMGETAWPAGAQEIEASVEELDTVSSTETRQMWLENIATDEQASLRTKYNRFRALPKERQEQLRQLYGQIMAADDSTSLQQTMLQYQQWLNGLPASQQADMRELPAEQRAQRVAQLIRQQVIDDALDLTPAQLRELLRTVRPRAEKLREEAIGELSDSQRRRFDRSTGRDRWASSFGLVLRDEKRREELTRVILEALPVDKREAFKELETREKFYQFQSWIRKAVLHETNNRQQRGRHSDEPSEIELEEFFAEQLDYATKERLLALPREKMLQQLERMYRGNLPHDDWDRSWRHDGTLGRRPGPPHLDERRSPDEPPGRRPFRDRPEGLPR